MKAKSMLIKSPLWLLFFLLITVCSAIAGTTIYVDDDATGANDGTSWENAYIYLQDALADANSAEKPVEIRVAQGIYKPDQGTGQTPEDREATFQLINKVRLNGGYAGLGQYDPNTRNIGLFGTILSGDLAGNDINVIDVRELLGEPYLSENSYHVVIASQADNTAVLDGFTITSGNADGPESEGRYPENRYLQHGAGMYSVSSSPILANCTFSRNLANTGGGMCNHDSNPTLTNCAFIGNSAVSVGGGMSNFTSSTNLNDCSFSKNAATKGGGMYNYGETSPVLTNCTFSENIVGDREYGYGYGYGGGMYNDHSDPILIRCTFSANLSKLYAGGMDNFGSNPTLTNCTFIRNSADGGGGIVNGSSHPTLTNCKFIANISGYGGGGIENQVSDPALTNCYFSGNLAVIGGGVYNANSDPILNNCLFTGNQAENAGGAIYNFLNNNVIIINSTFVGNSAKDGAALGFHSREFESPSNIEISNCIFWESGNEIWNNDNSTITVNYSNIGGVWPGVGNIDSDPLFADTDNGDFHLKSQAGRWNPDSQSWIIDNVTSPCIDAGDPNSPVYYEPIPNGGIINMGAYGGTQQASIPVNDSNYFQRAFDPNPADGNVNVDLDAMLSWLSDTNTVAHELYFGASDLPPFIQKQYETKFDPGVLGPNTKYFWRIDNIDYLLDRTTGNMWTFITGSGPAYARNPNPVNGDSDVEFNAILSWNPGLNAVTHNVYLGTDCNDVSDATIENPLDVLVSVEQDSNSYNPVRLVFDQTYYWRIDGINDKNGVKTGHIWMFSTGSHPIHAYNPNPASGERGVGIYTILSWSPGLNAVSHNVYFGTVFNDVNEATMSNPLGVLVSQGQDSNYYDPELSLQRHYYWRIDEIDRQGNITVGDIWEFDTIHGKSRACFTGDAPVWINNSFIPISKVDIGQSIDWINGIEQVQEHEGTYTLYDILLESGNCITVAENHIFMTEAGNWLSLHKLNAGIRLKTSKGSIGILSITKQPSPFTGKVYNLKIQGSDRYIVGKDMVIVRDY